MNNGIAPVPPDLTAVTDADSTPWLLRTRSLPLVPILLTIGLAAFALLPHSRAVPGLMWSFVGLAAMLGLWEVWVWRRAVRTGVPLRTEFVPVSSHYLQATVQFGIMLYWGTHWDRVYPELPYIFSQLVFLYALDALLSWSRGRTWRMGFGPLPIVISTNLLLWFKHDWYSLQFLMLTTGALAKQFITWNRDGRRTHIFNPSAFGQFLFAIVLIATSTTNELTWGQEIAVGFEAPWMLLVIFLGGLIVQHRFHVTLMTASAVAALCIWDLVYTHLTGVYFFVNVSIAAPIFLGVHLLLTDPATSPRTNTGRVIFGALYGIGYAILFRVLDLMEIPLFWDKLLPVPILNLLVPVIDRFVRSGPIGWFNRHWEGALSAARMNFIHMVLWISFFATMWFTGYIAAPHPGDSVAFWKQAVADQKPHAGHSLVMAAGGLAEGAKSGPAYNELALICMEGTIVHENRAAAARFFAQASELGDINGTINLIIQFLFLREKVSDEDINRALDRLEQVCDESGMWQACYLLGVAYETGRGRPLDPERALTLFDRCGIASIYASKAIARIALSEKPPPYEYFKAVPALTWSAERGDAESCWYLGYLFHEGIGTGKNTARGRRFLEQSCKLGNTEACAAVEAPTLPPYTNPVMKVPGWMASFATPEPSTSSKQVAPK